MQKVKWGVWMIANIVAAYYLRVLTFIGCYIYYFENRMPPDAGGIHQIHLTRIDVAAAIFTATFCSVLFVTCVAGFGLYMHGILWQHSIEKNQSKRWGWAIFIINWGILFFPAILTGYKFFVQRSAYF